MILSTLKVWPMSINTIASHINVVSKQDLCMTKNSHFLNWKTTKNTKYLLTISCHRKDPTKP